jgi:excinuclease UvrABC nuclease subunit
MLTERTIVMVDLAKLGFTRLPEWKGGIYALCDGDRIVYVGKTANIFNRIASHLRTPMKEQFDRVWFRPCSPIEADVLEKELIAELKPNKNKQHNPFDLCRVLGLKKEEGL